MVVFSKLSCSVFWLRNIENMDLPYTVKGKLGGPSQRRLATSITSSVLQGVCSFLILCLLWFHLAYFIFPFSYASLLLC